MSNVDTEKFRALAFEIVKNASLNGELPINLFKIENSNFITFSTNDDGIDTFLVTDEIANNLTPNLWEQLREAWSRCQ